MKRFDFQFDKHITGTKTLLPDFGKHILINHKGEVRVVGALLIGTFVRYASGLFSLTGYIRAENNDFCVTFDFNSEELWLQFSSLLADNFREELIKRLITEWKPHTQAVVSLENDNIILVDITAKTGKLQASTDEDYIPLIVKSVHDSTCSLIDPFPLPDLDVIMSRHEWWVQKSEELISVWCSSSNDLRKHLRNRHKYKHKLDMKIYNENLTIALLTYFIIKGEPVDSIVDFLISTNRIKKTGQKAFSSFGKKQSKLRKAEEKYIKTFNQHFLCILQWYISISIYDRSSIEDIKSDLRDIYDKGYFFHHFLFEAIRGITRPKAPELLEDEVEKEIAEVLENNEGVAKVFQHRLEKYPPEFRDHPEIKYILPRLLLYKVIVGIVEAGYKDIISPRAYARSQENIKTIANWTNCCSLIECNLFVPMGEKV